MDLLHIPDLILKLYDLILFYKSYFHYEGQTGTWSSKSNRKENKFEYNFLIICRYWNLVKKSEDNFKALCFHSND